MDRFTIKLDGIDCEFVIFRLQLFGCRAFIHAISKEFDKPRLFITTYGFEDLYMMVYDDTAHHFSFTTSFSKSLFTYAKDQYIVNEADSIKKCSYGPGKYSIKDWGPIEFTGNYKFVLNLNNKPMSDFTYETLEFQPVDELDVYKFQNDANYSEDYLNSHFKGHPPINFEKIFRKKHPLLIDINIDRRKPRVQTEIEQSGLKNGFKTDQIVFSKDENENDAIKSIIELTSDQGLFNDQKIYHAFNRYDHTEYYNSDFIINCAGFGNNIHGYGKKNIPVSALNAIRLRAVGHHNGWKKFNGPFDIDYYDLTDIREIEDDCGAAYIKKNMLYRKASVRKYALRWIYEAFRVINKLSDEKRKDQVKKKTDNITKSITLVKPVLSMFKGREEFNFIITICNNASKELLKSECVSYIENDDYKKSFSVKLRYDLKKDSLFHEEFGCYTNLLYYIRKTMGTGGLFWIADPIKLILQVELLNNVKKIIFPMFNTIGRESVELKAYMFAEFETVPTYDCETDTVIQKEEAICYTCVSLYDFINIFCQNTPLIDVKTKEPIKVFYKHHLQILGLEDIQFIDKNQIYFGKELNFINWSDTYEYDLSNKLIPIQSAVLSVKFMANDLSRKLNSKWYQSANKLCLFYPDVDSVKINGEDMLPTEYYQHPDHFSDIRQYVRDNYPQINEEEIFEESIKERRKTSERRIRA